MTGRRRYPGPDRGPRPVSESLDRALRQVAGPGGGAPAALYHRWEEIAGPELAPHATPLHLADGVLAVAVDHPARATAVRVRSGAILRRAREITGQAAERLSVTVTPP
jgi:predicted nucleic acid-binding Zn ribbon protein